MIRTRTRTSLVSILMASAVILGLLTSHSGAVVVALKDTSTIATGGSLDTIFSGAITNGTLTIYTNSVEDTYLYNAGNAAWMNYGLTPSSGTYPVLIRFNLSQLPGFGPGIRINKAELRVKTASGNQGTSALGYITTHDWAEGNKSGAYPGVAPAAPGASVRHPSGLNTATNQKADGTAGTSSSASWGPAGDAPFSAAADSATYPTTVAKASAGGFWVWTAVDIVNGWAQGTVPNRGFVVSFGSGTNWTLRLSEYGATAPNEEPTLFIDYDLNGPPGVVTDLAVVGTDWYKVDLRWTAPTDEPSGPVASYDLRYSTSPISSDADYAAATPVAGVPVPAAPGTVQTCSVTGLTAYTTYYFAMKTLDVVALVSPLSNVVPATTGQMDVTAPAAISNLALVEAKPIRVSLSWTASADDGSNAASGPASSYELRYSTSPISDDASFAAATLAAGLPAPKAFGAAESYTLRNLAPDTTYYVAIKAADEVPNVSAISNVLVVHTTPLPTVAPPAITNLQVQGTHIQSAVLNWTAPTPPLYATLVTYDVRYSTSQISDSNWDAATQAAGEPTPGAAGLLEEFVVSGLQPSTTYFFAVKTSDESEPPLVSSLSNVPSATTKPPVVPVTVHNPWIANDRVADCGSLAKMAATFDKAYTPDGVVPANPTDIETRAINSYNNFKRRWYHWAQAAPNDSDVVNQLNVFGWSLCGSHASMNCAIFQQMGVHARSISIASGGHTFYEVEYNGRWHALDSMTTMYIYDRRTPRQLACMADVKADKTLANNAVAEGRACPGFLLCGDTASYFADGSDTWSVKGDPGAGAVSKSMAMDLRLGETLKRTWESWSTQYYNNPTNSPPYHHESQGDWKDTVNFPYWEPYTLDTAGNAAIGITKAATYRRWANGTYTLAPDFRSAGYQASLASSSNIATFNGDGLSPDLHTAATGSLATAVFKIATPYYLTDLNIDGTFVRQAAGDINRIYVSGDGSSYTKIWDNSATGTTVLSKLNARAQVFGKYQMWVKIELQATAAKTDAGVSGLVITPVFEHNKGSMPYLDKGVNNITVTFDNPAELQASHNLIRVVYTWKENNGTGWTVGKQFEGYAMASPTTFGINVAGTKVPRTESILMEVVPAPYDAVTPGAIANLSAGNPSSSRVPLTWTAPADYDATGGPFACIGYDLRYSLSPITDDVSFNAATQVANVPAPKAPGSVETFSVKGLAPSTTHYFAIKAIDKGLNVSLLSNLSAMATTLAAERITNLAAGTTGAARATLTWTAIDDGSTGFMASYDLRYSTSAITDDATFNAATQVTGMPAPKYVGSAESFTVMYLDPGTMYYFAIKAVDADSHASPLSNVVTATTTAAASIGDLSAGTPTFSRVQLSWTAIDEGSTGTAASYDLRYSTSLIVDDATFNAAVQVTGEPTPKAAGQAEIFTVTGLSASTTYYFAIKAIDAKGRPSPLSNVIPVVTADPDPVAPRWVGDLKGAPSRTAKSVDLTWTAPADYGAHGSGPFSSATYDLRYSSSPITEANFAAATAVTGLPTPKAPGQLEAFTVTLAASNTTYYFAIKSSDEATPPNVSEISNCVAARSSNLGEKVLQVGLNGYSGCIDTYLDVSTNNFGASDRITVCGYGGNNVQRGMLRFDLSTLPAGTTVTKATLCLWAYDEAQRKGSTGFYGAYRMTRDWTYNQCNWTLAKTGVSWTTIGGDFAATPDGTSPKFNHATVWYPFDVTTSVQGWLAGTSTNYGWMIKCTDEILSNQDRFYPSETAQAAYRPKLVVSDLVDPVPGDISGDGQVDILDLLDMAQSWGDRCGIDRTYDPRSDLDSDGDVDVIDLLILADNWP